MNPGSMSDHDLLLSIHECLKGSDGQGGLFRDFENHKQEDTKFRAGFYAFRLTVIVAGALFFGGSGFGFAKLLELVK